MATNTPTVSSTTQGGVNLLFKLTILGKKAGSYYRYLSDSLDCLQSEIDEIDENFMYGVSSNSYAAGCIYWIDADNDQIEIQNNEDWKACFGYAAQIQKSIELYVIANYMVEFESITVADALRNAGLKRSFVKAQNPVDYSTISTVSSGDFFDDQLVGAVGERAIELANDVFENISKTRKDFEKRTNIMGSSSTLISSKHDKLSKEKDANMTAKYKSSVSAHKSQVLYGDLDMYEA